MTAHDHSRLQAAVRRTFAEVNNAILKITAHNALLKEGIDYVGMSFFVIASQALFNDLVANAIRVMDEHRDASSFWYIHKCQTTLVNSAVQKAGSDIPAIQRISEKLRHVREKTHFHIDRTAVSNLSQVWKDAEIKGDELIGLLRVVGKAVSEVNIKVLEGSALVVTEYDGSDVHRIVKAVEKAHGPIHGV